MSKHIVVTDKAWEIALKLVERQKERGLSPTIKSITCQALEDMYHREVYKKKIGGYYGEEPKAKSKWDGRDWSELSISEACERMKDEVPDYLVERKKKMMEERRKNNG